MSAMGTLEITIRYDDGQRTVYRGEAEWITDRTTMELVEGPPVPGWQPEIPRGIQIQAALCRAAVWDLGLDTEEIWSGEFAGGIER